MSRSPHKLSLKKANNKASWLAVQPFLQQQQQEPDSSDNQLLQQRRGHAFDVRADGRGGGSGCDSESSMSLRTDVAVRAADEFDKRMKQTVGAGAAFALKAGYEGVQEARTSHRHAG